MKMDLAERIQLIISYVLRGALLVAIAAAAFTGQWMNLFEITVIFFLTFLPSIISRNYRIFLPVEFDLIIVFFICASLYLGELHHFYLRFAWWDMFLHSISALIFGFIGFLIVYILNHEKRLQFYLLPKFVALFSFTFALSIGALWEMIEFGIDHFMGLNMQKSGLMDTMSDLILDALGALIASFLGYWYVRKGESLFFTRLIQKFIDRNPRVFRPQRKAKFKKTAS